MLVQERIRCIYEIKSSFCQEAVGEKRAQGSGHKAQGGRIKGNGET